MCMLVGHLLKPVCIMSKHYISALHEQAEDLLPEGDHHSITKVNSAETVMC